MKSFFKYLFFFIVAVMVWNWFTEPDIEIVYSHSGDVFDGFWAGILAPFITALVVIGAVFLGFGVVAAVFVAFVVAGISILFAGISIFWPVILAAFVLYWLFSDSKQKVS